MAVLFFGDKNLRVVLLIFLLLTLPISAFAEGVVVASKKYVDERINSQTNTKVDTSATAKQVMAGEYTVTGTLIIPTPPLPSAN